MDKLQGIKTYIVAGAIGAIAAGQFLDLVSTEQAEKVYALLVALGLATLRAGVAKAAPVVLLALGLSSAPASAQDATPTFGCGGGTCSIYFLDVSWPPAIGVNAVEFVRGRVGVGPDGAAVLGELSPLGGVCLIPRVGPALGPACQPIALGTGS